MSTATMPKPAELRTELENLGEKLNGLRSKERSDESRQEMRDTIEEIGYLDHVLRVSLRQAEVDADADGPKGGTRASSTPDTRSAGQRVVDSEEYRNWTGNGMVEIRALVDSTGGVDWSADADAGAGLLRPVGSPAFAQQTLVRSRLFIRDVLTSVQTGLANVPYIKELNAAANSSELSGALFVAEGSAKPEVRMEFTPADAPIRKLAAWIPVTTEILQDAPTLRGYIDSRLRYMLALAEERAILNGPGTGVTVKGIRQYSGELQTQSSVGSTEYFATIGRAIGKVETVDGTADFVAMNPGDYWTAVTSRHANQFDAPAGNAGSPFNAPPAQVWGVPVVRTTAMESGKALVGSSIGAVILDREGPTIKVGDQHSDYFTNNKVAILAEERFGLAVHRPDWYCEATVA